MSLLLLYETQYYLKVNVQILTQEISIPQPICLGKHNRVVMYVLMFSLENGFSDLDN